MTHEVTLRDWNGCLQEAERYLPEEGEAEWRAFAIRQYRARRRTTQLLRFYGEYPCHISRVHLLTACALMLGRFCGLSATFDSIGERLMPVTETGEARTSLWEQYQSACSAGQPWQIREELWLAAHCADLEILREEGLIAQFYVEAAQHPRDPTWQLLRQHLEVTLGERLMDGAAIRGMVAYETAMAQTMLHGIGKLFTAGWALLGRYATETARALFLSAPKVSQEVGEEVIGYRQCAGQLLRYCVLAWTASRIYRRGVRQRERGERASEEGWPLLDQVLGAEVEKLSPTVVQFYRNPGDFEGSVHLELPTLPGRLVTRLATLLTGQGLYEFYLPQMQVRFRAFRRADGSMHFLRELYRGETFRVFDSDFAVRQVNGKSTFYEVFTDMHVAVEMELQVGEAGCLSIQNQRILLFGIPMPGFGLKVEFQSRATAPLEGKETLDIQGRLFLQPRTRLGRFVSFRLLRRPEVLACLHYKAVRKEAV